MNQILKMPKALGWIAIIFFALIACNKEKLETTATERGGFDVTESDYGSITIEGKAYKTVSIGKQTWTEENFDGLAGIKPEGAQGAFGKYYTYAEANEVELPEGWRLPTENDYYKLFHSQQIKIEDKKVINPSEIKRLASTQLWTNVKGNNRSGFNALPSGYVIDKQLAAPGLLAEFWTANGTTVSIQEHINLKELRLIFYAGDISNTNKFNIRFVKDN